MTLLFQALTCLVTVSCWEHSTARHIGHEIIKVTQHSKTPRARRDVRFDGKLENILTKADFPKQMEFTLHLQNKDVKLVMEKQLSPHDIVISSDQGDVTFSPERSQYAVYQDMRTLSNMIVDCSHGIGPCTLEGTFHNGGRKWSLSPVDDFGKSYNATEIKQSYDRSGNSQINPNKYNNKFRRSEHLYNEFLKQTIEKSHTVRKRSSSITTTCNILEVELIVDYTVYDYFLARESGNVLAGEIEIGRHFLALFGETPGSSWSNILLGNGNVDAVPALLDCGLRPDSSTHADLTVCTTRQSIEFSNNEIFRAVGFFGTVCQSEFSDFQAIITEDLGDNEDLVIASQILPYLNATFDTAELDPECNASLLFIGSQFDTPPQENGTETNPWQFSNCSKVQLRDWLAFLDSTDNCLKSGGIDEDDFDSFSENRPLPGKIFDLDYQCQQSFGLSSSAVIGPGETSVFEVFDICYRGVYCEDDGSISRSRIYNGSPCGCKEICIKNECVREFNIPLGEACLGCCECADHNAICDCETRTCVCADGFYDTNLNMTSGTCKLLLANNETCPFDEACEDEFAICDNETKICVCIEGWVLRHGVCVRVCSNDTFPPIARGNYIPQDNVVGSIANLVCEEGYAPTSIDTCSICLSDGNFSATMVQCERDCGCPTTTPNGDFVLDMMDNTTFGSTATLVCGEGFSTNITVTITCEDTPQGWSSAAQNCTINDCGNTLPSVTDGMYDASGRTTVGSIGTLVCDHGYTPMSADVCIVCMTNGSWSQPNTGCIRNCGCPPSVQNGDYILNTGNTTLGSMATLNCCEGFSTSSVITITCEDTEEGWSSPSENCTINDCGSTLPSVTDGMFVTSDGTTVGSIGTLVCDHGYTLMSTDTCIVCLTNGSWSKPNTGCVRDCGCPPVASDGDYMLNTGNTTLGSMATLNCCEGYSTSSVVTITCENTTEGWSNPSGNCTIYDCGSTLPSVTDGMFVATHGTIVGSIGTLVCNQGYTPMSTVSCITCLTNGSWSNPKTGCIRDCGCPPVATDGDYILNTDNTTLGSMATLNCCEGYSTSSVVTITCEDTAEGWSDPSGNCTINDCGNMLPTVTNGTYVTTQGTLVGKAASLVCDHGYTPIATDTCIMCLTNGSWSHPNTGCIRDCGCPLIAPNGDYVLTTGNTTLGSMATLNCCEGYSTSSMVTITCEDTAEGWSNPSGNCTVNDCGSTLPSVTNGMYVTTDGTTVGSVGRLVCNQGFTPMSTDSYILCLTNGSWSHPNTECIRDCGCPPVATDGDYVLNIDNTTLGSMATLNCCEGYSTSSVITITCEDTEEGWSDPPENCTINDCGSALPSVTYGMFVATDRTHVGSIGTLICDNGYTPMSTDVCIVCLTNGSWSQPNTGCVRDCRSPPVASDGNYVLTTNNTTLGSTAILNCCEGYSTWSVVTITCEDTMDGWSDPSENCTINDCGNTLPNVTNGMYVATQGTTVGKAASLVCNHGYTPFSTETCIMCLSNGNWSHPNTGCVRDCECPPEAANGNYILNTGNTTEGSVATLNCCEGYSTNSIVTITCEDTPDGWSYPSENCIINDCGPTPAIANGSATPSDGSTVGSTAIVTCDYGFSPSSSETCIVCELSGNWSSPMVECIVDCGCPPKVANGEYILDNDTNTTIGSTAELHCCPDAFVMSPPVIITCESSGYWSSPLGNCTVRDCGTPPSITNGTYIALGVTTVGGIAVLSCDDGYVPLGLYVNIICTNDGNWSIPNTICLRDCGCPPEAPNGAYTLTVSGNTTEWATALLSCCPAYETSTTVLITCENTVQGWSDPVENCSLKVCSPATLPSVANGEFVPQAESVGSLAILECDNLTSPDSNEINVVCQMDGTWSSSSTMCIRDCGCPPEAPNGAYTLTVSGNTTEGATALLSCCPAYETSTTVLITCENTLQGWSDPVENCSLKVCSPATLPSVDNGEFVPQAESVGSLAILECDNLTSPDSNEINVVCQMDGTWSSSSTMCIRDCGCPPEAPNGAYTLTVSGNTTEGATALLSCCPAYETSTTVLITCENTLQGWSDPVENCSLKVCSPATLPSVANGEFVPQVESVGSLAILECDNLTSPDSNEINVVCQMDGTWSSSSTVCIRDCGCPPEAPNGAYTLTVPGNTTEGATALLSCCPAYETSTTVLITCENTLQGWSDPVENCSLKVCSASTLPSVANGEFVPQAESVGSLAILECDNLTSPDSNEINVVCQMDGTWSSSSTMCITDCGCPPEAPNGAYTLTVSGNTTEGATALLSCCPAYETSTTVLITCENTAQGWSDPVENCSLKVCSASSLPSVANGEFVPQAESVGSLAILECDNLTSADSNEIIVVCQMDGTWSSSSTMCIRDCGCPPEAPNGAYTLTVSGNTTEGATASLSCCPAYETSTTVLITCENTAQGWSDPVENCSLKVCNASTLPSVANGEFVPQAESVGSLAILECDDFTSPDSKEICIVCQMDGTWSSSSTMCITDCGIPPITSTAGFFLQHGTTNLGDTARICCSEGNAVPLLGFDTTITCTASGWSNLTTAICRNCPSGWTRLDNTCYLLQPNVSTYLQAVDLCDTFDSFIYESNLVKIDNEEENELLKTIMDNFNPQPRTISSNNVGFWIGLVQLGANGVSETWLPSGLTLIDTGFADWTGANPDRQSEFCTIALQNRQYEWADIECVFNGAGRNHRTAFPLCEIDLI